MAVVLDSASEDVLIVMKLERSQVTVFQSLSCDNVNGRLFLSCTCLVGMVPFFWY